MRIIPAIDLLGGKCVRLFKGDYEQVEVFHENPVEMAKDLESAGFKYLHLVDLDGARGSGDNQNVLKGIANETNLVIDFGGGLRTHKDVTYALENGAHQANIGSMAVKAEDEFIRCISSYGDRIVWNADLKDGRLAIHGWQDTVDTAFDELVRKFSKEGLSYILTTDISKDGTLEGSNLELYQELMEKHPDISWIASGGVKDAEEVIRLKKANLFGAVIGKAIYKGTVTFEELIEIQNAD